MEFNQLPPQERSAFMNAVWTYVRQVPRGKVVTYGQVAAHIPPPAGVPSETYEAYRARWVGQAMAECPADVPWQRVINSEGKVSPRRGADEQRRLLESEGVIFDAHQRVNLKHYGWTGLESPSQPGLFNL